MKITNSQFIRVKVLISLGFEVVDLTQIQGLKEISFSVVSSIALF